MTTQFHKVVAAGFAAACGFAFTAHAGENEYIERYQGSWSGSGTAIIEAQPVPVTCRMTGQPGDNRINIQGNCRAAIFGQPIAADVTFDPATGRYSGIYIGDRVGPARLTGKRRGNVVELTITWPKPVNGDTNAQMRIENTGKGILRISVDDNQVPGGMVMRSDFILSLL